MFYECDNSNCNLGAEFCNNRAFEDLRQRCKAGGKYNVGVEVIKTADRGYGVRSNRTFDANQIIVEYAGEIITQDECDSRMAKLYKDNEVILTKDRASSYPELTRHLVLLSYVFRSEHDHRCHSRVHRPFREPLLRTELQDD